MNLMITVALDIVIDVILFHAYQFLVVSKVVVSKHEFLRETVSQVESLMLIPLFYQMVYSGLQVNRRIIFCTFPRCCT